MIYLLARTLQLVLWLSFLCERSQGPETPGRLRACSGTERTITLPGRSHKSKSASATSGVKVAAISAASAQTWAKAKSSITDGREPCIAATQCGRVAAPAQGCWQILGCAFPTAKQMMLVSAVTFHFIWCTKVQTFTCASLLISAHQNVALRLPKVTAGL